MGTDCVVESVPGSTRGRQGRERRELAPTKSSLVFFAQSFHGFSLSLSLSDPRKQEQREGERVRGSSPRPRLSVSLRNKNMQGSLNIYVDNL